MWASMESATMDVVIGSGVDDSLDPSLDDTAHSMIEDTLSEDDLDYSAPTIPVTENSYLTSSFQTRRSSSPNIQVAHEESNKVLRDSAMLAYVSQIRHGMPRSLRDLGVILESRLRKKVPQITRGAATAWIDRDNSGTYHPTADRVTPPPAPSRRMRLGRDVDETSEDESSSPREAINRRKIGWGLPMTFYFVSASALDYLRSISTSCSIQHTDEGGSLSNSGYGSFSLRKIKQPARLGETNTRRDGLTLEDLTIGHPQRRGCKACFLGGDDDCSLLQYAFGYPCTACEDSSIDCEFIVPPKLKKVCESCKRNRVSCSFREDAGLGVDSCKACEKNREICCAGQLQGSARSTRYDVVGSKPDLREHRRYSRQYTACNECRVMGLRCSLRSKSQQGPCKHCVENDHGCSFILVRGHRLSSRLISGSPASRDLEGNNLSKGTDTTLSRSKSWQSDPPNLAQSFSHEYLSHSKGRQKLKRSSVGHQKCSRIEEISKQEMNLQTQTRTQKTPFPLIGITNSLRHIFISTSFCHPISFNHRPSPMHNTPPCTFCSFPLFGLFGHGIITVEIIPYAKETGHGNEEMPGGHAEKHPTTKMCRNCTFQRVKILGCRLHELKIEVHQNADVKEGKDQEQHIDRDDSNSDNADANLKASLLGASLVALDKGDFEGGRLAIQTKWCAICPSPATHRCCSLQPEQSDSGCGLLLCSQCADLYSKVEKGMRGLLILGSMEIRAAEVKERVVSGAQILDRTIKEASMASWGYEMGVRADAEFLSLDGELVARMRKNFGTHTNIVKVAEETNTEDTGGNERIPEMQMKGTRRQSSTSSENKSQKNTSTGTTTTSATDENDLEDTYFNMRAGKYMPTKDKPSFHSCSSSSESQVDSGETLPLPSSTKRRRITRKSKPEKFDPILAQVLTKRKGALDKNICGPFAVKKYGKKTTTGDADVRDHEAVLGEHVRRGNTSRRGARRVAKNIGVRGRSTLPGRVRDRGRARARGRGLPTSSARGKNIPIAETNPAKTDIAMATKTRAKEKSTLRSARIVVDTPSNEESRPFGYQRKEVEESSSDSEAEEDGFLDMI